MLFDRDEAIRIIDGARYNSRRTTWQFSQPNSDGNEGVLRDIAWIHEYAHHVQYMSTSYGVLVRHWWDSLLLCFACELRDATEANSSIRFPLSRASSPLKEFSGTLGRIAPLRVHLGLLRGHYLEHEDHDWDSSVPKEYSSITMSLDSAKVHFVPGAKVILEAFATHVHRSWIRRVMGRDIADRIISTVGPLDLRWYAFYQSAISLLEEGLPGITEPLEDRDRLPAILDWAMMIPLEGIDLEPPLAGTMPDPRLSPWWRLVVLVGLARDKGGGRIPEDLDDFVNSYPDHGLVPSRQSAVNCLQLLEGGRTSSSRMHVEIAIRAMEQRLTDRTPFCDPVDPNPRRSGEKLTTRTLEVVGWPSAVNPETAAWTMTPTAESEPDRQAALLCAALWDLFETVVEGHRKPCMYSERCEDARPLCGSDFTASGSHGCPFDRLISSFSAELGSFVDVRGNYEAS